MIHMRSLMVTRTPRVFLSFSGIRCVKSSVVCGLVMLSLLVVYNLLELSPRASTSPLLTQSSSYRVSSIVRYIGQTWDGQNIGGNKSPAGEKNNFTANSYGIKTTPRKLVSRRPPKESQIDENETSNSSKSLQKDVSTTRVLHGEREGVSTKLLVWHMIPRYRKHGPNRVSTCGEYQCVVSTNTSYMAEADVVLVDVFLLSRNRIKEKPVRTSPNQAWVFFTREPWQGYSSRFPPSWDGVFNWTLTYQSNSDIHIPYGEVYFKGKPKTEPDWSGIMKNKTQSVFWLVSNCDARSKRMDYVNELKKHIDVHIVGKCGIPTCGPNVTDWRKDDVKPCYAKSRFYLAFESSTCQDYVTEKFYRTFGHHIIPIVRGKANYSKICPNDLFIDTADYSTPKELAGYLKYLQHNETAYLGYLKRRVQYRVGGDWLKTCQVCSYAHNLEKHRRSYPSITSWIDSCEPPEQPPLY